MKNWLPAIWILLLPAVSPASEPAGYQEIDQPPHLYWQRPLNDRVTRLRPDLESGRIALDRGSEKAFLLSLLKALEIPASSQMLVFSTTSLQLPLIKPRNPRALFFNEDTYLGFVPGGRIEIVSLDPEVGGIYYLVDIPRGESPLRIERSTRCMNCHASADTRFVPGLVIKSVVPGPNGGSLKSFRKEQTGHDVPFEERFGGWFVTGKYAITNHWGNTSGRLFAGELTRIPLDPATAFSPLKYPLPTSDILPQLIHEHQAGFVNRVLEASYRARTALHADNGRLTDSHQHELDGQANLLTRYLLFADEAPLPRGGVTGDVRFKNDFLSTRKAAPDGASLQDFDLRTRLFKHRCSYMIHSRVFAGMPAEMKERVYRRLGEALNARQPDKEYAYLPAVEKESIRTILKATQSDLPKDW